MRSSMECFKKGSDIPMQPLCMFSYEWEGNKKTMRWILTCYENLTGILMFNQHPMSLIYAWATQEQMTTLLQLLSAYHHCRLASHTSYTCTTLSARKPEMKQRAEVAGHKLIIYVTYVASWWSHQWTLINSTMEVRGNTISVACPWMLCKPWLVVAVASRACHCFLGLHGCLVHYSGLTGLWSLWLPWRGDLPSPWAMSSCWRRHLDYHWSLHRNWLWPCYVPAVSRKPWSWWETLQVWL